LSSACNQDKSDAVCVVADRVLAVDSESGNVCALYIEGDGSWSNHIREKLLQVSPLQRVKGCEEVLNFKLRDSKNCYTQKIHACQSAIAKGEAYELCLTTQIESDPISCDAISPLQTYLRLRKANPAPYGAFFHFPHIGLSLLSASPERYLKISGTDRIAQVKPIKGTRPRGFTPEEDRDIKHELSENRKDLANGETL
jgi:para-aminobenzoate synthetase